MSDRVDKICDLDITFSSEHANVYYNPFCENTHRQMVSPHLKIILVFNNFHIQKFLHKFLEKKKKLQQIGNFYFLS